MKTGEILDWNCILRKCSLEEPKIVLLQYQLIDIWHLDIVVCSFSHASHLQIWIFKKPSQ